MGTDRITFDAPEPYADAGWCGVCAACTAARRRSLASCGCPPDCCPRGGEHIAGSLTIEATTPRCGAGPTTPACLHSLGRLLAHALYYRAPLSSLPLLRARHVLAEAVAVANRRAGGRALKLEGVAAAGVDVPQTLTLVSSHLQRQVEQGDFSTQTVNKVCALMGSLAIFMTAGLRGPT